MADVSLDNAWSTRYHTRADKIKTSADVMLLCIILLLLSGAVVFVFASYITEFDRLKPQDNSLAERIASTRAQMNKEVEQSAARTKAALSDNSQLIRAFADALYKNRIGKRSDPLPNQPTDYIIQYSDGRHLTPEILAEGIRQAFAGNPKMNRSVLVRIDANTAISYELSTDDEVKAIQIAAALPLSAETRKAWDVYDEEERKSVEAQQHNGQLLEGLRARQLGEEINSDKVAKTEQKEISTSNLIQTSITRIGAVATISFLVAILVPLYRYNIRLAAFYTSIGDALAMTQMDNAKTNNLEDLIRLLTPAFDFGKAPKTPVETAAEVAKLLGEKASKAA